MTKDKIVSTSAIIAMINAIGGIVGGIVLHSIPVMLVGLCVWGILAIIIFVIVLINIM